MPDWCTNRLIVSGEPSAIAAFAEKVRDDRRVLSFERIRPTPPALAESSPDRAEDLAQIAGLSEPTSQYTWRVSRWGTKWDLSEDARLEDDPDPGRLVYLFGSAWSAPLALVEHAVSTHPDLGFELVWYSPATGEAGLLAGQSGEITENTEVSGDPSSWLAGLGLADWTGSEE